MDSKQLPLFPADGDHALTSRSALVEAVTPFLEHLRMEGRSPHTITAFSSDLRLAVEYFGADMTLKNFTTPKLERFMEWVESGRGISCSRKSYARRVTALKVFFKFLKQERVLSFDPAEALLQRSGAAPLQPILSDDDLERMFAHTTSLRFADKPDARPDLLLRLLLDTGLKKSECMLLTAQNIQRDNSANPVLTIRHPKPGDVYKERNIALDSEWLTVLDEYLEQYKPQDALFSCTARNLEYVLHDIATASAVGSKVSFEILRWTSAVRDYRNGMNLDRLREKMGLSRISWRETSEKIILLAQHHLEDNPL